MSLFVENLPSAQVFALHTRLSEDCFFIKDLELSRVLLMNDRRFPWIILVPRVHDLPEVTDLAEEQAVILFREIKQTGDLLKKLYYPDRLNIGALGNIVSQVHIHVIARRKDDEVFPKPVWGCGMAEPYEKYEIRKIISDLRNAL